MFPSAKRVCDHLAALSKKPNFPHLLFVGGSNGHELIRWFLDWHFGKMLKLENRSLRIIPEKIKKRDTKESEEPIKKTGSKKKGPEVIDVLSSARHVEVNADNWKGSTQELVLKNLIFTLTSSYNILTSLEEKESQTSPFQILVIHHAETLNSQSQHCILQLIEKHIKILRIIFSVNFVNRFIPPLESRCLVIRVPFPTQEEMRDIVKSTCEQKLSEPIIERISFKAKGNIQLAKCITLETMKLTAPNAIWIPEYMVECQKMLPLMLKKDSQLSNITLMWLQFKTILDRGFPAEFLVMTLFRSLMEEITEPSQQKKVLRLVRFFMNQFLHGPYTQKIPLEEMFWFFQNLRDIFK